MHPALIGPMLAASLNFCNLQVRQDQIAREVAQLSSPEQADRSNARHDLMDMSASELHLLKNILARQKKIPSSIADPLHDAVVHVFVRSELMKLPIVDGGMLGIANVSSDRINQDVATDNSLYTYGLTFELRPGQIAYRYLERGDLILAAGKSPMLHRLSNLDDLRQVVFNLPAGSPVTLFIQRGPERFNIAIPLDPRFRDLDNVEEFNAGYLHMTNQAEDYWDTHFARFFAEHVI